MTLSPKEQMILTSKGMFITEKQALKWLADNGYKTSHGDYVRTMKRINENTRERMFELAKNFKARHLDSIEKLNHIERELWKMHYSKKSIVKMVKKESESTDKNGNPVITKENKPESFEVEPDFAEKRQILKDIAELQLYHTAFGEAAQDIEEESIKKSAKELSQEVGIKKVVKE